MCYEIKSHTTTTQIQNQKFSKYKEKMNQALIEVKNKWEFEGATWSDYKRHKHG